MKTPELFKEYIWLLNTIYQAGKMSFADINEKWLHTEMSGGLEISRTTFNRHKYAIEDIFGIIIDCDKKDGFKYYVTTDEYSDFSYFLSPSDDFIGEILRKKDRISVISPKALREKVLKGIMEMGKNYKNRKKFETVPRFGTTYCYLCRQNQINDGILRSHHTNK